MTNAVTRVGLLLLGLAGLQIGVWATFAPRSFYDDFPGGGRAWVAADGPYNEHLVRDFGSLNLGLTAVVVVALITGSALVARAAALAWLVYSLPHFVYHARHLDVYDGSDKALNLLALGTTIVVPVIVLAAGWRRPTETQRPSG